MRYGAKMLMWAPFAQENAEPAGALPTYGTAKQLGELNKVTDAPAFNEAKAYGDNGLGRYVNEFKEVPVDVEILDLTNELASELVGAKLDSTEGRKDLHFNAEDNAPYGGLSFYINELLAGNVKKYKGIFYPKVKAAMQGKEYNTKGDTITLVGEKLHFLGSAAKNGDWKIESEYFATEAEAEAWVKGKLGAT